MVLNVNSRGILFKWAHDENNAISTWYDNDLDLTLIYYDVPSSLGRLVFGCTCTVRTLLANYDAKIYFAIKVCFCFKITLDNYKQMHG